MDEIVREDDSRPRLARQLHNSALVFPLDTQPMKAYRAGLGTQARDSLHLEYSASSSGI